jgi:uncharacterized protein (TIGR00299 family) protein
VPEAIGHLHLDPMGGMAGDMFVAALLDAFPEHARAVEAAAGGLAGVACRALPHRDAVLTGSRFQVDAPGHHLHHDDHHHHTGWREIEARLQASALSPGVKRQAIGIFSRLAEAEAQVHGIAMDDVTFHEVGSADSVADIVAAAWLIDAFPGAAWSVGPLPLGSGRVRTAHGMLPVPAPATALLLRGMPVIDDGIQGERVTPTGAAILRHLAPSARQGLTGRIARTGSGFGTRTLPGVSNIVRVLAFTRHDEPSAGQHRQLSVICFEVDDQSPEDLATALDRLRTVPGVHDVLQSPVFGKKGRMGTHVQLLVQPGRRESAIEACFDETTTIGLRIHEVEGRVLPRQMRDVTVEGRTLRVKTVERPGGRTSKAESDDLREQDGHAARTRLRRAAEGLARND